MHIRRMANCIQKPTQPVRQNALARRLSGADLNISAAPKPSCIKLHPATLDAGTTTAVRGDASVDLYRTSPLVRPAWNLTAMQSVPKYAGEFILSCESA